MSNANAPKRRLLPARPDMWDGRVANLLRGPHGPGSPLFWELARLSKDFEVQKWEFMEANASEAIGATKFWQYAESNAGATDPAKKTPTTKYTSCIDMASSANDYQQTLAGQKMFSADAQPWFEVRFEVDQVTKMTFSIGFVDALPASAAAIVTDIDTPAMAGGIADAALFSIDLAQTLTTAALVCRSTSAAAVTKTNASPVTAPYGVPTAATFLIVKVALVGDRNGGASTAYAFVNDQLVASQAGPDGDKLMVPVFRSGAAVDGTGVTATIDYFEVGQQKRGTPFGGVGGAF